MAKSKVKSRKKNKTPEKKKTRKAILKLSKVREHKGYSRVFTLRFFLVFTVIGIIAAAALITGLIFYGLISFHVFKSADFGVGMMLLIILVSCLLLGSLLTFFVSRLVIRPMDDMVIAMNKAADGDFSKQVSTKYCHGEVKRFVSSFNWMLKELSSNELFRKDFINNFSHEFKTPIVSVRGFAQQLLREDLTEAQRKEYAELIVSESEKLTNMSSRVLVLTKLENQEFPGEKVEYSLDEQLRTSFLFFQNEWEKKAIEPILDLDSTTIFGNKEMLEHVWSNLISNAIKFSNFGGTIKISCKTVKDNIEVVVADNGLGMDEETVKNVFDKFYQGDAAHASAGNGLGLPIAKRVVEINGGTISVDSIKGVGSRFVVHLPTVTEYVDD